jgi:hypothetical protein
MNEEHIKQFCKGSEIIYIGTSPGRINKTSTIKITGKEEVHRSRTYTNGDYLFNLKLDIKKNSTLEEQIYIMKTIELVYPNKFSWRFDGKNLEAIGVVPTRKNTVGAIGRYGGYESLVRQLRKRISYVLRLRDIVEIGHLNDVEPTIISTGSLNLNTNLYCVDIEPEDTLYEILHKATNSSATKIKTPVELDLRFWVKEANPDFYKEPKRTKGTRYKLTKDVFDKYPIAIKRIAGLRHKGNYNRFLLATYLLSVHNQRDAKYQLDLMLSDEEKEHITNGNCKDQWRTILSKNYSPPSPKTLIEAGFATTVDECISSFDEEQEEDYKHEE